MGENFGVRLKKCRNRKSLSQKELGNLVGVSAQVISNIERGYTTGIGPDEIARLADLLDTTTDYLILGIQKEISQNVEIKPPSFQLNPDEAILVKQFREASNDDKDVIWMILKKYKNYIL